MSFILNLFRNHKHDIPPMRLKHAGFSIEERKALRLWTSDAGYYR